MPNSARNYNANGDSNQGMNGKDDFDEKALERLLPTWYVELKKIVRKEREKSRDLLVKP